MAKKLFAFSATLKILSTIRTSIAVRRNCRIPSASGAAPLHLIMIATSTLTAHIRVLILPKRCMRSTNLLAMEAMEATVPAMVFMVDREAMAKILEDMLEILVVMVGTQEGMKAIRGVGIKMEEMEKTEEKRVVARVVAIDGALLTLRRIGTLRSTVDEARLF
jgi:hypothetical protein